MEAHPVFSGYNSKCHVPKKPELFPQGREFIRNAADTVMEK